MAKRIDLNQSTISRIEAGKFALRVITVRAMLDLYDVEDEALRDTLLSLAQTSSERGWWQTYGSTVPDWFEVYIGLESGASTMRLFASHHVPGLFQTPDFAAELFRLTNPTATDQEITRLVEVCTTRQARLTDGPVADPGRHRRGDPTLPQGLARCHDRAARIGSVCT